jgi:molybdate transport system substrate-binding protein
MMSERQIICEIYHAVRQTLWAALTLFVVAGALRADTVTVFAAASLKTALDKVAENWRDAGAGNIVISYAGSSALARQIEAGAPADLFISANIAWMDHLAALDLIDTASRIDLLGNQLVLIGPAGAAPVEITPDLDLIGLLGTDYMAMALVEAVPAGIYGHQALTQLGLWAQVRTQVAQLNNVRAALVLVARGEAPLGVVYATDALAEPDVGVLGAFPPDSHSPIVYPAALVSEGTNPQAAAFLQYLSGPLAQQVFAAHGFEVLN